ncbi:Multidrug resistance-associated protein 1 [Porphyridium purpureum]|uniref:Probable ATP-dependent transporter ycf16 n=1 Tax=Porphyridium purpureum TaxID=35688 RepID=A0A5J4ZA59_PORPP|nr:Multidrug resistance-associated protein 1 [Porphyridium purpureum]|eukprot:POR0574..scf295_1
MSLGGGDGGGRSAEAALGVAAEAHDAQQRARAASSSSSSGDQLALGQGLDSGGAGAPDRDGARQGRSGGEGVDADAADGAALKKGLTWNDKNETFRTEPLSEYGRFVHDDPEDDKDKPEYVRPRNPEEKANILAKVFLWWVFPFILAGYRKPVDEPDLWELSKAENAEYVVPRFADLYETQKPNKKGRRLVGALLRSQRALFWYTFVLKAVDVGLGAVQPVFVNQLLSWYQDPTQANYIGYLWAFGLFLAPFVKAVFENHYFLGTFRAGLRVRTQIQGLLYAKSLRLSASSRAGTSVGKVVNLMQLDAEKIAMFCQTMHGGWGAPAQLIVAVGLLFNYIGVSALIGLAFTILTIPLQGKILSMLTQVTRKNATVTDSRVKLTNEIFQGIKAVKFYAWERPFYSEVDKVRCEELANLNKSIVLRAVFLMILFALPSLVAVFTFTFYIAVFNNTLDPAAIFTALSLLNNLRVPLMMFPFVINSFIESRISAKRIELYMDMEDSQMYTQHASDDVSHEGKKRGYVEIKNGTFTWGSRGVAAFAEVARPPREKFAVRVKDTVTGKKRREKKAAEAAEAAAKKQAKEDAMNEIEVPVLKDVNLVIHPGELVAVIGRVGAGKSSLAQALLGEVKKLEGDVLLSGQVAYVPQNAWIFNGTLQENILFGAPMDRDRYVRALFASSLETDLDVLPAGDLTAIGEKGINLSGGQKQRVSIARAVYANCDIVVFDDPLSALDAHVGKAVFDHCLSKKGVLRNSARMLVTNQLHFVPECDRVVVLEGGEVVAQGTYKELMAGNESFRKLMQESNSAVQATEDSAEGGAMAATATAIAPPVDSEYQFDAMSKKHTARLLEKMTSNLQRKDTLISTEDRNTGNIKLQVYLDYAKNCGGTVRFIVVLIFFAVTTTVGVLNNWWLSYWSEEESVNPDRYTNGFYLGIYFLLAIAFAVMTFIRTIIFLRMALGASKKLHERCYFSVTHAPMEFFDTTPIGRILSRFSKDVGACDTLVPQSWQQFLNTMLNLIASYILIAVVTPIFTAVAIPVSFGYWLLQRFYNRTNLEVKRLDSISKSPIYAHFSETLGGLSTIRAFGKQEAFREKNLEMINVNHRAYFCQLSSNRWFSLWLEALGSTLILAAAIFGVLQRVNGTFSGLIGLSLTYALQVTSFLGFTIRSITELEAQMNAVERLEYFATKLPQEAPHEIPETKPDDNWPDTGEVQFENLQLRYRSDLELVLKGVSLDIKPGTKVGIVGRTGAGKSSLMVALLRLVEPTAGTIIVDGVDITKIGLEDLRSRITIIPQDPVMFSGSIRKNLDPFNQYEDATLWDALAKAHLKGFVSELEGGLDGLVSEYGDNLSAGQRQLICLVRALLRQPRVLVMDEATSSVDHETDQRIQETVRSEFSNATILTIAHRLWTIADYDRVLVMDHGLVAEYGTPAELLANADGILSSMVNAMGTHQSQNFKDLVASRSMETH